MIALAR